MKPLYKDRANDLLQSVEGKIKLINYMIDGTKQPNPAEAKMYIKEILDKLDKIGEIISIS